jgi:hypothetical protein
MQDFGPQVLPGSPLTSDALHGHKMTVWSRYPFDSYNLLPMAGRSLRDWSCLSAISLLDGPP